jgi:5-methylcytosine-specific restriction endonuclease McrA
MTSDPKAGQKLRVSIDLLAKEYSQVRAGKGAAIVDTFLPDETAAELVQDLIGDVVFRFLLLSALKIRSEVGEVNFDDSLEKFILNKTRLTGDLARRLRQNLKQAVLATEEERPKSERKARLKEKQKHKKCYLCSGTIEGESVLDHVWPRSAGGGNGKSNLHTAHASCEAVKADIAVCGDAPVGRFAFNELPRSLAGHPMTWWPSTVKDDREFKSLVDDIRGSQLKIAILSRQQFQCHSCKTSFSDTGDCRIIRRNEDEPWWFANVVAICDSCGR